MSNLSRRFLGGLAALSLLSAVGLEQPPNIQTATLYVDDDFVGPVPPQFATIQAAVDAAAPGDEIHVAAGEYVGAVVNKDGLTIVGEVVNGERATTINVPGSLGHALSIQASGVTVCDLAMEDYGLWSYDGHDDGTVTGLRVTNAVYGIRAGGDGWEVYNNELNSSQTYAVWFSLISAGETTNNTISGNTITDAGYAGIVVTAAGSNYEIADNTITGDVRYAIDVLASGSEAMSNFLIESNTIETYTPRGANGIFVGTWGGTMDHFTISNNAIQADFNGIWFYGRNSGGTIDDCVIRDNVFREAGIYFRARSASIRNNTISGNVFADIGPWHAIDIRTRYADASDNTIIDNDYSESSLPGWTLENPDGPGCIWLHTGSGGVIQPSSNLIDVRLCSLPPGTSLESQIRDEGVNNTVVSDAYDPPYVHPTADVDGSATIGNAAWIGPDAKVEESAEVGPGARLARGSVLEKEAWMAGCAELGEECKAEEESEVGHFARLGDYSVLKKGAVLGNWVQIGSFTVIEEGVVLGERCTVGDFTKIEEDVEVGDRVHIGSDVVVKKETISIGDDVTIGDGATITASVPDGTTIEPGEVWE